MLDTFRYVFLALVRNKGMMVWTLLFPLILLTCFLFMFAGLDQEGQIEPIPVIVVENAEYELDTAFQAFIEGASDVEDDDRLLAVTFARTSEEAQHLLSTRGDGNPDFVGIIELSEESLPQVMLASRDADASAQMDEVYQSIVLTAMDTYLSKHDLAEELMGENPGALMRQSVLDALSNVDPATRKVSLTQSTPKESVRYYFALLGFAGIMGGQISLIAVLWLLPRTSALGARRALGGVSRARSLLGTLLACWFLSYLCLLIAYAYLRFVVGVDFIGRDLACLGALAAASLMATSLGAAIAVIPKINDGAKSGILTAIVCVASLFAGLYGQPTMRLADLVASACPAAQWFNPAVQVSEAMFSAMYYDTLVPYFSHIIALLVMAVVLFICSAAALRRQRYASI